MACAPRLQNGGFMSNRLSRVWFFVTDWFPIYLVAKGIPLKSSLLAVGSCLSPAIWEIFWWRRIRLSDQAGMVSWRGEESPSGVRGVGVLLLIPTVFTFNP